MFIPTTRDECRRLGWDRLDVILVTGDSYIDSPFMGVAVIGKMLMSEGYRVGIIAQPDVGSDADIGRLGEPALFWGVTGGSVDSMVANTTATLKKRRRDDYTPGGQNNRRPDRALIVYTNLIRRYFKKTRPIVLGGIEASLRRISHYDYWSDRIRRSVLFDAKADYLVYGMGERTVIHLARRLRNGEPVTDLRGLCYISPAPPPDHAIELPSHHAVVDSIDAFVRMFTLFSRHSDPVSARGICQLQDTRYLVQNPPSHYLSQQELDAVYDMPFELAQHPYYERQGVVRALDTIQFAVNTHRGCYGHCHFCAISVHQGRQVRWRSRASIEREVRRMTSHPDFKGVITDVGGPTANMYGIECDRKAVKGACPHRQCLFPDICPELAVDHSGQLDLLDTLARVPGVRRVFVSSGIRHDLVMADGSCGARYIRQLAMHHTSGQIKVAPEHSSDKILNLMGKPGLSSLLAFKDMFFNASREAGKRQYLTYYVIAAHPGCTLSDMRQLRSYAERHFRVLPRQVQIFTPTPSTWSTLMYYTGRNPWTRREVYVEKDMHEKYRQKAALAP